MGDAKGVVTVLCLCAALLACSKDAGDDRMEATPAPDDAEEQAPADPKAELARKILILDAALAKLEGEVDQLRAQPNPDVEGIAEREAKIEALRMTLRQSKIKLRALEGMDNQR